jgi:acyl-coenzyme A thioesterase PaaI-like protein
VGLTDRVPAFDEATAAHPAGAGRYDVRLDERFAMGPPDDLAHHAVNGGVLIATVLRAVLDSSPHPHPVATSTHFLRVPRPAPAQVLVTWLKEGKTAATARATLVQQDQPVLEATATTGTLGTVGGPGGSNPGGREPAAMSWTGEPPRLPPVGECIGIPASGLITGQVSIVIDPATAGWLDREPAGVPEMRGYFRLREDRDPDAYLLALAVDALPPVVFGLGAVAWAPTVELTWHMRAVPVPGLLRVAARCRHVSGGWFDEEAEVWDAAGQLVAQSRQLARVGRGS